MLVFVQPLSGDRTKEWKETLRN